MSVSQAERTLNWNALVWPECRDAAQPLMPTMLGDDDTLNVLAMRQIRNEGREWYGNDTRYITMAEQLAWWRARDRASFRAWLYVNCDREAVGFLTLTRDADGLVWSSLGVASAFAGRGYAKCISRHALAVCPTSEVWSRVRQDNTAMVKSFLGTTGYSFLGTRPNDPGFVYVAGRLP